MHTTMTILAAAREAGGIPDALKLCMVFGLGIVLPLLAIALVIMAPVSRARDTDPGDNVGLGETSLQEEFWRFIDDVEQGRVSDEEVAVAVAAVTTRRSGHKTAATDTEGMGGEGELTAM